MSALFVIYALGIPGALAVAVSMPEEPQADGLTMTRIVEEVER